MIKKYIEKIIVYILTLIVTLIGVNYIFASQAETEVAPIILLSFFLLIMFIYIYYMNRYNQKLENDTVILKRNQYYMHKYSDDELENMFADFKNKKITKKEFKEKVYGDKEKSYIEIPVSSISNVRKVGKKYYMHIDELKYDVEITNYKVLKHLLNISNNAC